MELQPSKQEVIVDYRGKVRLPQLMVEMLKLKKGTIMDIWYGDNCSVAIVVPHGAKFGKIQQERFQRLIKEPLETEK